ncbi:hypothetical protein [Arthrobacter sp. Cr_A7]|uniref:hypothetical protein n=1 Tax=Arthrobacter sp. Cr_A7 TaxID=3031017 RepID=UPI0023DC1BD1|nr:hypothetical protein [Arthrobacter sp. Cr_A7]MDF2048449.1 hypothetical protein [Arthrobacter sp. Cr_A7]
MTPIESVAVTAQVTFGRDGAMFEGLLGFVAQLSVVLWCLVVFTAVIRFVGIRIYRRAARAALVEEVAMTPIPTASRATGAVTNVSLNEGLRPAPAPAAVAASAKGPRPATRSRQHAERRSASQLPALTSSPAEA